MPDDSGIALMTTQTFGEIQKELSFSTHYKKLADLADLLIHPPLSFGLEEQITGEYAFRVNTHEVWREITNTLLTARYLLAQSRAYKDVELLLIKEGAHIKSNEVMNVHLAKMNAFDGAIYRLAKIEDLFLLLLFVNLGNSLVETNTDSDDWQKKITWNAVRDGLRKREPAVVSNRYLNALSQEGFEKILAAFQQFKNPKEVFEITSYRDATTHRIAPNVDYEGFRASLVFPKGIVELREKRVIKQSFLVPVSKVDFEFLPLYKKAAKVFGHYVQVLRELKQITRFA